MIMKPAVTVLLAAIAIFCCASALAGSVEIGFVDKAGLDRWMAGGPAEVQTGETACKPAKFNKTSACLTVVISNQSSHAVTLSFTSDSEDFSVGLHESITLPGSGPQPCYQDGVPRWRLQPGKRCYAPVEFWPRTGEVHHATIHVSVASSSGPTSASFKVKGTSDYPPELQAAEEVRQRHARELMKLPHVASVELDNKDGIKINVTVNDVGLTPDIFEAYLEDVRRQVPPKIEGYDTEVTQYVGHGYFN
jgi:hypothetical protein